MGKLRCNTRASVGDSIRMRLQWFGSLERAERAGKKAKKTLDQTVGEDSSSPTDGEERLKTCNRLAKLNWLCANPQWEQRGISG